MGSSARTAAALALLLAASGAEPPVPAEPTPAAQDAPVSTSGRPPAPQQLSRTVPRTRARDVAPLIGLVPSDDDAITEALADGARLALAEAGGAVTLRVAEHESRWDAAAAAAVRMALDEGALAIIAPPERKRAHAIAQMGTRAGVPIVSTSPAPTVAQTGSSWVVSVVPPVAVATDDPPVAPPVDAAARADFVAAFTARHGRAPDGWALAGYDAARTALATYADR